jgi:hypothetical protein
VRLAFYEYRFTTWAERRERGVWWHRTPVGAFEPVDCGAAVANVHGAP